MKHLLLSLLLCLSPVGAVWPAWADTSSQLYAGSPSGRNSSRQGNASLDTAVAQVRRTTHGRILSAETISQHGRRVHRIKVLTPDNRVRIIMINAGK